MQRALKASWARKKLEKMRRKVVDTYCCQQECGAGAWDMDTAKVPNLQRNCPP